MPSRKSVTSSAPAVHISLERSGNVLVFTLDNPANGNEVTGSMFDAMLAALRKEALEPSARVLRIRAQGPAFCTGRERAGRDVASIRRESARLIELKRSLRSSPLITIAEVHGDAFGFGLGLAVVCDFVLVSEDATLAFPEMRSGLAPAAIMAYLGEYVLPRFAFPLVLFGEPIKPEHALQIGLISQVSRKGRLAADADALVDRILQLDPAAARRCKEFFLTSQQNSFDQNCRLAVEALTIGSMNLLAKAK